MESGSVLEVAPVDAAMVHCLASASALGELRIDDALVAPIAPGELLVVSAPRDLASVLAAARSALAGDPHALILDLSDAYDGFRITGDRRAAFARCADWPLLESPPLQQGMVAQLAAKVVPLRDALFLFVGSHVGHHLRRRMLAACADLGVRELGRDEFRFKAAAE
jgi:hypothetical protein